MRTQDLNPAPLLRVHNVHALQAVVCPECRGGFPAGTGVMACVPIVKGEEQMTTYLIYCSTVCLLGWFHPVQMGRC